jgi:hypothetical protein
MCSNMVIVPSRLLPQSPVVSAHQVEAGASPVNENMRVIVDYAYGHLDLRTVVQDTEDYGNPV